MGHCQFSVVCHLICDIIFNQLCRNCIAIILFSISIMGGHCNLVNSVNHNVGQASNVTSRSPEVGPRVWRHECPLKYGQHPPCTHCVTIWTRSTQQRIRPCPSINENSGTATTLTLWKSQTQNDRGQRYMEKVRPWCGQPSDRGQLKNKTEQH